MPVCATFDVNPRAAFQARGRRSGVALAATNGLPAGANCKRHDAAPVLFGRAASAAGQVRRLGGLNAKLGAGPYPALKSCRSNSRLSLETSQAMRVCSTDNELTRHVHAAHATRVHHISRAIVVSS